MSLRISRINELISQQLSLLFHQDFPSEIISINFISTTPDLTESKIFISIASGHQSIYNQIISSSSKYWKELSNKIEIRKLPKLLIIKDEMQNDIARVEELLERK